MIESCCFEFISILFIHSATNDCANRAGEFLSRAAEVQSIQLSFNGQVESFSMNIFHSRESTLNWISIHRLLWDGFLKFQTLHAAVRREQISVASTFKLIIYAACLSSTFYINFSHDRHWTRCCSCRCCCSNYFCAPSQPPLTWHVKHRRPGRVVWDENFLRCMSVCWRKKGLCPRRRIRFYLFGSCHWRYPPIILPLLENDINNNR